MSNLGKLLTIAIELKPAFGQDCNHCGYCCLTEPCVVGKELTGKTFGPCELLQTKGDKHYCSLVETETMTEQMGFGTGCCAKTQNESIAEMMAENA